MSKFRTDPIKEFETRKIQADDYWEKIYKLFKLGKVDKDMLVSSMTQCNNAEKAFLNVKYNFKTYRKTQ